MPAFFVSQRCVLVYLLVCIGLAVAGCGKSEAEAGQVIATVNGEEIHLSQLNAALAKVQGMAPEDVADAKLKILESLVEQQLAVNLAIDKKLDRTPEVLAALESSRREILARAAWDQTGAVQPAIGDDDARKFYVENPALFSERRVFTIQEITLKMPVISISQIRLRVASAKRLDEVSEWLRDRKVEFSTDAGTRPAEQFSLEMLSKLQSFKDGQIGLLEDGNTYAITQVLTSRAQPIAASKALSAIKLYMHNQRVAEAVRQAKLDMKSKATLAYFGEFAGGEAAFKARAEADAKMALEIEEQVRARTRAYADALAEQLANQQAAGQAEQDARDKLRALSGKWPAPTKADAIIEKGIKGL